jgi:hypothetical protein
VQGSGFNSLQEEREEKKGEKNLPQNTRRHLLKIFLFPWSRVSPVGFKLFFLSFFFFFSVPGLELRAYTLSHSTSPFCVRYFLNRVSQTYLPRLTSNCNPPDLYLLSSLDYRHEPPVPGWLQTLDLPASVSRMLEL